MRVHRNVLRLYSVHKHNRNCIKFTITIFMLTDTNTANENLFNSNRFDLCVQPPACIFHLLLSLGCFFLHIALHHTYTVCIEYMNVILHPRIKPNRTECRTNLLLHFSSTANTKIATATVAATDATVTASTTCKNLSSHFYAHMQSTALHMEH